jgi:hypothetical protein
MLLRRAEHIIHAAGRQVSRPLSPEQVLWIVIGLLAVLFVWLLLSGDTTTGRGWT